MGDFDWMIVVRPQPERKYFAAKLVAKK